MGWADPAAQTTEGVAYEGERQARPWGMSCIISTLDLCELTTHVAGKTIGTVAPHIWLCVKIGKLKAHTTLLVGAG